jgi:hypothetical protein
MDIGQNRVRELTEQIAVENDHDKFTALVTRNSNRLLDSDRPPTKPVSFG